MSHLECKFQCGEPHGILWPLPRTVNLFEQSVSRVDPNNVVLVMGGSDMQDVWLNEIVAEQEALLLAKAEGRTILPTETGVKITVHIPSDPEKPRLTLDTDESYSLDLRPIADMVEATVNATTYFGARHGLETLFQLIDYDDIKQSFVMIDQGRISDGPAYPHRGVSVDTSRNFISIPVLKNIVNGMSHSKVCRRW